jgi:hypothetical protein
MHSLLSILGAITGAYLLFQVWNGRAIPSTPNTYSDLGLGMMVRFIDTWIPQTFIILPRVAYRYFQKRRHRTQRISKEVSPISKTRKDNLVTSTVEIHGNKNSSAAVLELLTCYPTRKALLEDNELSYMDILNLATSSRAMWRTVFGSDDLDTRIKPHSCHLTTKQLCWCCRVEMCSVSLICRNLHERKHPSDGVPTSITATKLPMTSCYQTSILPHRGIWSIVMRTVHFAIYGRYPRHSGGMTCLGNASARIPNDRYTSGLLLDQITCSRKGG